MRISVRKPEWSSLTNNKKNKLWTIIYMHYCSKFLQTKKIVRMNIILVYARKFSFISAFCYCLFILLFLVIYFLTSTSSFTAWFIFFSKFLFSFRILALCFCFSLFKKSILMIFLSLFPLCFLLLSFNNFV